MVYLKLSIAAFFLVLAINAPASQPGGGAVETAALSATP